MYLADRMMGIEEFLAVAEAGSFIGAAEKLGLTPSGVGKAVQRLETRLGVQLFARTTRRVTITEEGALFQERCARLVADIGEAEAEIDSRRTSIAGLIRVGAPIAYGRIRVVPPLVAFMKAHPDIEIDLKLSDQLVDPIEERIDLMVRIGVLEDSSMWAKQIDRIRFGIFASADYLALNGEPKSAADLERHERLGFRRNTGKLLQFTLADKSAKTLGPTSRFVSNEIEAALVAAQHGLGAAYLPTFLAATNLKDGTLKQILESEWIEGPPVHLLHPRPRQMPRRVKALATSLFAALHEK